MPFTFNGNTPETIVFNGNDVMKVVHNGTTVWEKVVASTVTLYSTYSYYRLNDDEIETGDTIKSPGDGYGCLVFPAHDLFATFSKATIHLYVTTKGTFRSSPMIGTYTPGSYATSVGNYVTVTPSTTGWFEVDITSKVQTVLTSNANLPTIGLRVYLRKGNAWVSSHTSENPPYIVLE